MHVPEQWHIIERETSPSTNTELKDLAAAGAPEGTVLIAHRQTAGRGRLGRSFFSPAHTGLYLSVLLRPQCSLKEALRLTPIAAVAAARAADALCGTAVGIKWVNDLYLDGKKVCGILTECTPDPQTGEPLYVICGAGFNLFPPKEGFPSEIASLAGSLTATRDPTLRPRLAREFAQRLREGMLQPFDEILEEYRRRSVLIGKTVVSPTASFPGRATVLGIDDEGGLCIRCADGTERVLTGGEVSVRLEP